MLKKRPKFGNTSDWSSYKENFSDLLEHPETPKRKVRILRPGKSALGNVSSVSQEIHSVSSDEEKIPDSLSENFGQSSPVLRGLSPTNWSMVKSTPSGSPVLKSHQKRSRISSLIPLSPITPGFKLDYSLQNQSVFSAHFQESRHEHFSLDQTPLAVPLDFSDEDIDDTYTQAKFSSPQARATQNADTNISEPEFSPQKGAPCEYNTPKLSTTGSKWIQSIRDEIDDTCIQDKFSTPRVLATQDVDANISEPDFSPQKKGPSENDKSKLSTTGSEWIQSIKEKIEADWQQKALKYVEKDKLNLSYYDSGRKNKFVKGGLAEQLSRVLKKEHTQKTVFLQRLKTGKLEKQNPESMVLKIISDQKEGILHVLECKEVRPKHKQGSHYYTILLPDEFVDSLNLDLGMKLRMYPPFYKMKHQFQHPVLLSAYYINMLNDNTSPANSENLSCDSLFSSPAHRCESLLTALEMQPSVGDGISVVATVQRVFCKEVASRLRWSLLCEDAYGTFFDIKLGEVSPESAWLQVTSFGEGQRVVFKDLSLSNRVTRTQYPNLFTIIDSIWCSTGRGLLHVNSSQTDESQASVASVPLLPPNYCYILHSENDLSSFNMPVAETNVHCATKSQDTDVRETTENDVNDEACDTRENDRPALKCRCNPPVCSDLNRPAYADPRWTDVLYKPPNILTIAEVLGLNVPEDEASDRFSLCCNITKLPKACCALDSVCHEHSETKTFLISDCTATVEQRNVIAVMVPKTCHIPANVMANSVVVFKDIYKQADDLFADCHSRITAASCTCEIKTVLGQQQFPPPLLDVIENLLNG